MKIKKKNKEKKVEVPDFLKTGKAKRRAMKTEKVKEEIRDAQRDKLWSFRIPGTALDDEFLITFLDGDLGEDGELTNPVYYQHSINQNGKWINFASCCEEEPDPLQEAGNEPTLVQAFTVINHTPYETQDGKVYRNRKQTFIATRATMKRLEKMAGKRGGLRGCTFEVSRTSAKAPAVGDVWNFVKKRSTKNLKEWLVAKKKVKQKEVDDLVQPADYKKEITYYTAKQQIKMGFTQERKTISTKSKKFKNIDDEL